MIFHKKCFKKVILFVHYRKIKLIFKTRKNNYFQYFPLLLELFNFEVGYINAAMTK